MSGWRCWFRLSVLRTQAFSLDPLQLTSRYLSCTYGRELIGKNMMISRVNFLKMLSMCMCKVLEIKRFRDFPFVNYAYSTTSINAYILCKRWPAYHYQPRVFYCVFRRFCSINFAQKCAQDHPRRHSASPEPVSWICCFAAS